MANQRLIKKYPNRRLYDTHLSKYVTLDHVRDLVIQGLDLKVVDAVTEDDLTRQVLMQIITDQESGDSPLFSAKMLSQFIRLYRGVVPGVFGEFMEKTLAMFLEQQGTYQKQVKDMFDDGDPMQALTRMTERNLELWKEMQDSFFRMSAPAADGSTDKDTTARAKDEKPES